MIKSLSKSEFQEESHQYTRNYEVVSIRHSNREEHFQKRRKVSLQGRQTQSVVDDSFSTIINQFLQDKYSPEQMEELLEFIKSQDVLMKHHGVIGVRKIIDQIESQLHNCYACPELKQLSSGETLSLFIGLARLADYPRLVYEGTLCLANVVSVNSIDQIVIREEGIMEALIELLSGDIHILAFQNIVLAIGNITVGSKACRDYFISMKVIDILIDRMSREEGNIDMGLLANGCWVLTNLCRGQQLPSYDKIERAVLYLACFFQNITDSHVANDCLSVISQQFTRNNGNLDKMILSGAPTKIIHCLNEGTFNERGTVLGIRILGNLSAGESSIPRQIVEEGLIQAIAKGIIYESSAVKRQTCWLLSNIIVGNEDITKQVLMHPTIMPQLKEILNSGDILPKKEAFFVAANLTSTFSPKAYLELIVETELLSNLNDLLLHKQWRIICAGLMCLKAILGFFDREGDIWKHAFLRMLEKSSGRQILEDLQFHEHKKVYSEVSNIIKKYMDVEEEIEIPFSPPSEESQTNE